MPRTFCRFAPLLLLPALAACVNDGASYAIEGSPQHTLSILREQNRFWEDQVEIKVVVARMPECQRKHWVQKASPTTPIELWQPGPQTFILKVGPSLYVTETRTCEGFARLEQAPPGGNGTYLGRFALDAKGVFTFLPAPAAPAEAARPLPPDSGNTPAPAAPASPPAGNVPAASGNPAPAS
jgi:hypothetical protein